MVDLRKNPAARANLNYHDFPMHQHVEFTSTVGQLLPVYFDWLDPGDKVRCSQYLKTRTQPLASAAMAKLTEHIEWFFVPIQQIYKPFGSFIYGVQDLDSSLYNRDHGNYKYNISEKFPYIDYKKWILDFQNSSSASLDEKTLKNESALIQMLRLFDHFGISIDLLEEPALPGGNNPFSWTPLLACAYQKIFMDHYRNGDRIANDPDCYNLDRYYEMPDIVDELNNLASGSAEMPFHWMMLKYFQMRYRPTQRDFFTNNFPSPIFSQSSASAQHSYEDILNKVNQWLTSVKRVSTIDAHGGSPIGDSATNVILPQSTTTDMLIKDMNPANIRTLFASEKLLELTRRAGKHYDAQTLAHFGVDVPSTIEGQSFKLGHHSQEIMIGDVIATAESENVPLGEIAGKGYSAAGSQTFDFKAPCHGVLMAIYSCEPSIDYYQRGLDKLNCLIEKSDFFMPEYDNLGMQPLFGYQVYLNKNTALSPKPESWNTSILGWQYRYMEMKQKANRIFGGLRFTQKHWTIGRDPEESTGTSAASYYHNPDALNSIMEYPYLGGYIQTASGLRRAKSMSEVYEQDPLIHEIFFDVKKASKKSPYGLQQL